MTKELKTLIYGFLKDNPFTDTEEIAEEFGIDKRKTYRLLKKMESEGLLGGQVGELSTGMNRGRGKFIIWNAVGYV